MNIRQWLTFACMACTWGCLTHVTAHYTVIALNTWRVHRADQYFERHIRMFLQ